MGKWVTWMMLGAFLVSIPMLGVAQTTPSQDDQTMTADQQPPAAAMEDQQTSPATEEQPPMMVTPSKPAMQPAKPLPPLALERRMMEARRPRMAKATSACPARPACDRGTTRKMAKRHLAGCKVAKHRAARVCMTRTKYHRLVAAARGHKKMVMHRAHKRMAMHRMTHRRMARHRGPSHVCITRAKYHRLMAMARSHRKMAAHRLHRRVAMYRAHRRIAMAGPMGR